MEHRPNIPSTNNSLAISDAEKFQNESLRQVIKMQHEVFIFLMKMNFREKKDLYYDLSEIKKKEYIESIFKKDNKLRATIIGTVIGQFNQEERGLYSGMRKEIDKRILQIVLERVLTNQDDFTSL